MENNYFDAIKAINPNATWSMTNNDLDQITWLDGTTPIAKELILAKVEEVQTKYEAEKQAKIDAKASALAKLEALGLTQEEVKAIL
jgi:hypothetical protein